MFDNIGGKIKTLATSVCVIGIIASVIGAVALWASGNKYNDTVLSGLIVLGVGCLVSWVGSFFAYGFGELISQNERIMQTNREILKSMTIVAINGSHLESSTSSSAGLSQIAMESRISALASEKNAVSSNWVCDECTHSNPITASHCFSCGKIRN